MPGAPSTRVHGPSSDSATPGTTVDAVVVVVEAGAVVEGGAVASTEVVVASGGTVASAL